MSYIGSIARVRRPQTAGLLNDDGTPASPFTTTRLSPETPFLIEGVLGNVLYVRLLRGKHAERLAAITRQELDLAPDQPRRLMIA